MLALSFATALIAATTNPPVDWKGPMAAAMHAHAESLRVSVAPAVAGGDTRSTWKWSGRGRSGR